LMLGCWSVGVLMLVGWVKWRGSHTHTHTHTHTHREMCRKEVEIEKCVIPKKDKDNWSFDGNRIGQLHRKRNVSKRDFPRKKDPKKICKIN
jgi:hypothetical protein